MRGRRRLAGPDLDASIQIFRQLRRAGHSAYLVGGCVRDLLLGIDPKDFDIATSATPAEVGDLFPESLHVGAQFGVMLVPTQEGPVEVATYRSDFGYTDGRRPSAVRFESNPYEDAIRRDFTINALFLDPDSGEVLDFVEGRDDLGAKLIRAIGDPFERFEEDKLRLLRAIRFAARLGFDLERQTEGAIVAMASKIHDVSAERIRGEIVRILTEGGVRRGMELLDRTGLLREILPEVAAMKGVEQPPQYHPEGDVWTHTLLMLEGLKEPSVTLALGVLLHDVGKPPTFAVRERIRFDGHVEAGVAITRNIMERLRFSREESEQVVALVANHMKFMDAPKMKVSTLKRFLRLPAFDEHLELHRQDCLSSHGGLDNLQFVLESRQKFGEEEISPPRLVSGDDLIAAGYRPSSRFGEVLRAVEDAQLEGRVRDREAALTLAKSLMDC